MVHPPQPGVVHPLPPAPNFVGRDAELEALRTHWRAGGQGVVALVGLGGAGKTAIAACWLYLLLQKWPRSALDGVFVWSFYQQPDAGSFLREACQYFVPGDAPVPGKGAGLLAEAGSPQGVGTPKGFERR